MLVLSRKKDEVIVIGDDIEITVVDIRGDQVKIGVSAPRSVSIHRKEVYEAIQSENRAAAISTGHSLSSLAKVLPKRDTGAAERKPGITSLGQLSQHLSKKNAPPKKKKE